MTGTLAGGKRLTVHGRDDVGDAVVPPHRRAAMKFAGRRSAESDGELFLDLRVTVRHYGDADIHSINGHA
jgi:hypothetical protein